MSYWHILLDRHKIIKNKSLLITLEDIFFSLFSKSFMFPSFFLKYVKTLAEQGHCSSALNVLYSKYSNVKLDQELQFWKAKNMRTFRVSSVILQKPFLSSWGPLIPCPGKPIHSIVQLDNVCMLLCEKLAEKVKGRNNTTVLKENNEVTASRIFPSVKSQYQSKIGFHLHFSTGWENFMLVLSAHLPVTISRS